MSDFLDRKTTLAEAKDLVALHTLQFAKRQKTWFNGAGNVDRAIHWISPTTDSIDSMFKKMPLLRTLGDAEMAVGLEQKIMLVDQLST